MKIKIKRDGAEFTKNTLYFLDNALENDVIISINDVPIADLYLYTEYDDYDNEIDIEDKIVDYVKAYEIQKRINKEIEVNAERGNLLRLIFGSIIFFICKDNDLIYTMCVREDKCVNHIYCQVVLDNAIKNNNINVNTTEINEIKCLIDKLRNLETISKVA